MQGIFLVAGSRPRSKKEVKEACARDASEVFLQATSVFGNEYDGRVSEAPDGTYYFVGPDPFTSRKFYGTITVRNGTATVK